MDKYINIFKKISWDESAYVNDLYAFLDLYRERPIRNNDGGMNSSHLFYVWWLIRKLKPIYIIESGVFKGQGTWLLEQAAPSAKLFCIDPDLSKLVYQSKNASYLTRDFNDLDWSHIDGGKALVLFDDHYGSDRIIQAQSHGFRHLLYEDNYPLPGGNCNHPSGDAASPKALFDVGDHTLAEYLDIYYEFPPIVKNQTPNRFTYTEWSKVIKPPLLSDPIPPEFKIYQEEAWGYTWIAYMQLK